MNGSKGKNVPRGFASDSDDDTIIEGGTEAETATGGVLTSGSSITTSAPQSRPQTANEVTRSSASRKESYESQTPKRNARADRQVSSASHTTEEDRIRQRRDSPSSSPSRHKRSRSPKRQSSYHRQYQWHRRRDEGRYQESSERHQKRYPSPPRQNTRSNRDRSDSRPPYQSYPRSTSHAEYRHSPRRSLSRPVHRSPSPADTRTSYRHNRESSPRHYNDERESSNRRGRQSSPRYSKDQPESSNRRGRQSSPRHYNDERESSNRRGRNNRQSSPRYHYDEPESSYHHRQPTHNHSSSRSQRSPQRDSRDRGRHAEERSRGNESRSKQRSPPRSSPQQMDDRSSSRPAPNQSFSRSERRSNRSSMPTSYTNYRRYNNNNYNNGRRPGRRDNDMPLEAIAELLAEQAQARRELNNELAEPDDPVHQEGIAIPHWNPDELAARQKAADIFALCPSNEEVQLPYPVKFFKDLGLNKMRIRYETLKDIQKQSLNVSLLGYDTWIVSETGSGKTFCYAIPAIEVVFREKAKKKSLTGPFVLILLPTQELTLQVCNDIKDLAAGSVTVWNAIGNRYESAPDIVVSTMGSLLNAANPARAYSGNSLSLENVSLICLDEVDKIQQEGRDHYNPSPNRPILTNIAKAIKQPHQTVLLTATLPEKDQEFLLTLIREPWLVKVFSGYENPAALTMSQYIEHCVHIVADNQGDTGLYDTLKRTLQANRASGPVLVFCNSRREVDEAERQLKIKGVNGVRILHSGLKRIDRKKISDLYQRADGNSNEIFVTTDVLSRGIHNPHTALVINFKPPRQDSWYHGDYNHRVGRAGRQENDDYKQGKAVTILHERDRSTFAANLVACLLTAKQANRVPKEFKKNLDELIQLQIDLNRSLEKTDDEIVKEMTKLGMKEHETRSLLERRTNDVVEGGIRN